MVSMDDKYLLRSKISKKRRRKAKFRKRGNVSPNPVIPSVKSNKAIVVKREGSRYDFIESHIPANLKYLLFSDNSPWSLSKLRKDPESKSDGGVIFIPEKFSICEAPKETVHVLKQVISALFIEEGQRYVWFDYSKCNYIGIETQAFMDVILLEYTKFLRKCIHLSRYIKLVLTFPEHFGGRNILDKNLQKLMFSVGSPANLGIREADFEDVLRLPMRSHCALTSKDKANSAIQKEIDTTEIVDHVLASLNKMNKTLTPIKLKDLSTVVGEILINAEEHSTLRHRFSMAYFQEYNEKGKHYGMIRFVILNIGKTIYDNFSNNTSCPLAIVEKMKTLSAQYTRKRLFRPNEFDEETLWTLYALQQGVTSVPGKRRGSGTIQFIRSFFNIKGSLDSDSVSKMYILSGNTEIIFDGKYGITERIDGNNRFQMMTFNDSGLIDDAPDSQYVKRSSFYFPGTIITANILLNDDDVQEINS